MCLSKAHTGSLRQSQEMNPEYGLQAASCEQGHPLAFSLLAFKRFGISQS